MVAASGDYESQGSEEGSYVETEDTMAVQPRTVAPPQPFSFQPKEWPAWRKRFDHFYKLSKLDKEGEDFQISSLLYAMGDKADELFSSFAMTDEDRGKYKEVIEEFDKHFVGKKNVVYERAVFNSRNQREGETFEEYVTVLHSLSEHCEYGNLREDLVRDRIVLGVRDKALSQKLMMDGPNLQKATEMSRRFEAVKRDHAQIRGDTIPLQEVDRVQKPQEGSSKRSEDKSKSACFSCGLEGHRSSDKEKCPASNVECHKCKERGHFMKMCKSDKTVRAVRSSSIIHIFTVDGMDQESRKKRWQAEVTVDGAPINFKLDPGADATILPYYVWKQLCSRKPLKTSNVLLQGPNGSKLNCVGVYLAELINKRRSKWEQVYVVKGVSTALLGLAACEDLCLVKRINEVDSEIDPKAEFPGLFTGLGKMDQDYGIKRRNGAEPYAISCSTRVPLPLRKQLRAERTLMANGYTPTELWYGRRIRATLPGNPLLLDPEPVDHQKLRLWENERRRKPKTNYDRRHKVSESSISEGEKVWVKDKREWGDVQRKDSSRSYWVKTASGEFRRNAFYLEPVESREAEDDLDFVFPEENDEQVEPPEDPAPEGDGEVNHNCLLQSGEANTGGHINQSTVIFMMFSLKALRGDVVVMET